MPVPRHLVPSRFWHDARTLAALLPTATVAVGCADSDRPATTAADEAGTLDAGGDGDGDGDGAGDGEPSFDIGGDGDGDGTADDGGNQDCIQDVDIVFVMDVSTTMGPFFDALEQEIVAVHETLAALPADTDPQYGLVVFVDDYAIINAGAPFTDPVALRDEFQSWNQFTATNAQTSGEGFNDTWTENSLDAIYAAAEVFQWRPKNSTLRLVIHTTDDTFWEGPTTGNGVQILRSYPETVSALQQREIRFFTFAAFIGGQDGATPVSQGFFTEYEMMPAIPVSTGGGATNIDEVVAGVASLSDALEDAVIDNLCQEYPPVG